MERVYNENKILVASRITETKLVVKRRNLGPNNQNSPENNNIAHRDCQLEPFPNDSHNYLKYLNPPNPLIPHTGILPNPLKTLDRQCTLEAGEGYSCKSQFITIHHISRRFQMPT